METRAEHFLRAMEKGKVSTNIYLRRIHNFALGMNWLPVPVIPSRMWSGFSFKEKRAITLEEHRAIVAREVNGERRAFYELAWHIGASQSDIAYLEAENVDWKNNVISYEQKKSGESAFIRFGKEVERILSDLPSAGPLFPYPRCNDRRVSMSFHSDVSAFRFPAFAASGRQSSTWHDGVIWPSSPFADPDLGQRPSWPEVQSGFIIT